MTAVTHKTLFSIENYNLSNESVDFCLIFFDYPRDQSQKLIVLDETWSAGPKGPMEDQGQPLPTPEVSTNSSLLPLGYRICVIYIL